MQSENRSCKAYKQKDNISDLFIDTVPLNCANCIRWSVEADKCKDIAYAKNCNDPELVESIGWCVW